MMGGRLERSVDEVSELVTSRPSWMVSGDPSSFSEEQLKEYKDYMAREAAAIEDRLKRKGIMVSHWAVGRTAGGACSTFCTLLAGACRPSCQQFVTSQRTERANACLLFVFGCRRRSCAPSRLLRTTLPPSLTRLWLLWPPSAWNCWLR